MTASIDIGPEHGATPPAEVEIDEGLLRRLLAEQHPDLAEEPLAFVDSGWDNVTYRVGTRLAARLPRRKIAAVLLANEQRWLTLLAPRLPLPIPAPVRLGAPSHGFPFAWSLVPWFEGETADRAEAAGDQGPALAAFLRALHRTGPPDAPTNPFRGVPLAERQSAVEERLERRRALIPPAAMELWRLALEAPMDMPSGWLHGDLHARNVLVLEGRLRAVIDWGDMCVGDPATDLAGVWMLLASPAARAQALSTYGVSPETMRRAQGWAFLFGVMLLDSGLINHPAHAAMGKAVLQRLAEAP
jgi:aminoglycoside phosphotransferase (APT) family kinase protein